MSINDLIKQQLSPQYLINSGNNALHMTKPNETYG